MAEKRTGTQNSTSTTSSVSSRTRVVVFELDTDHQRTARPDELEKEHITQKYQFDIKRWQRHVNVRIPGDKNRSEASANVAKIRIPMIAVLGRFFGNYKQMWVVSAA